MCVCVLYEFKVNKSSIKLTIFKPFITILSNYIFFKITCDVGITQFKYKIVKCDVSRLPTCEYGVPQKSVP